MSIRYKPTPRECALLFLKLIQEREERRKNTTRCRLPAVTVRNLWNRELLTEAFLDDVQDWLLSAGWAFINAGSTFGAVKVEALKNWPRVASGRIKDVLNEVKSGKYDFSKLEPLMATEEADDEQEDE
jgi:hypothetical protein